MQEIADRLQAVGATVRCKAMNVPTPSRGYWQQPSRGDGRCGCAYLCSVSDQPLDPDPLVIVAASYRAGRTRLRLRDKCGTRFQEDERFDFAGLRRFRSGSNPVGDAVHRSVLQG